MSPLSPNSQRSSLRVSEHPWRFLSPLRSCPTPSNAGESPFSLRHVWVAISAFPSPSDPATKASNSLHREVSSQPPPPPVLLASSWLFLYFVAIKKAQEKKKKKREFWITVICCFPFSFSVTKQRIQPIQIAVYAAYLKGIILFYWFLKKFKIGIFIFSSRVQFLSTKHSVS